MGRETVTIYTDTVWPQVRAHSWKYRPRTRDITGILWHCTRGGQWYDGDTELGAYMNWCKSPNNRNPGAPSMGIEPYAGIASAGIGPGRIIECVPDGYLPAWSSWPSDETKISVEVAQSNPGQPIEAATIASCVEYARAMAARYGFPLERVMPVNDWTWVGMAGHEDTVQGRASGKTDPGPEFWVPFLAALNQEEPLTNNERTLTAVAWGDYERMKASYNALVKAGLIPDEGIGPVDDLNSAVVKRGRIMELVATNPDKAAEVIK